jgi:hypothetical protein
VPLSGDYDGDGKTDFGYYNPNTKVFVDVPSSGAKPIVLTNFGGPGDIALSSVFLGSVGGGGVSAMSVAQHPPVAGGASAPATSAKVPTPTAHPATAVRVYGHAWRSAVVTRQGAAAAKSARDVWSSALGKLHDRGRTT